MSVVEHQLFAPQLSNKEGSKGDWITISQCPRDEIEAIERRRRHYPKSSFKTRWVERTRGKIIVLD